MKRLDKPTKHKRDDLLNFKKKTAISLKTLLKDKLPKNLIGKTSFLWLIVSLLNLMEHRVFYDHLKPAQKITVKGGVT